MRGRRGSLHLLPLYTPHTRGRDSLTLSRSVIQMYHAGKEEIRELELKIKYP